MPEHPPFLVPEKQDAEAWQARAAFAELLALSFRQPDRMLASAVASGEWLEAARDIASLLEIEDSVFEEAELLACDRCGQMRHSSESLLHVLRVEATWLFVGAPKPVVSPYEGIWRAESEGVLGLLFVNPHSTAVERFIRSCGLGRPEGTNEPLDHIASELELLSYLAQIAAGAQPASRCISVDSLPGGSAQTAYETFVSEHVCIWMPAFARAVRDHSRIPFFRVAARMLCPNKD